MTAKLKGAHRSIRGHLIVGLSLMLVLAGGFGGWAATAQISGALIAPGSVVVDSNVKKVQHPTGGVVGEVRVRDGDIVKAGDIVVRLDETVVKAGLAIVVKTLNGLWARAARLEAEQRGLDKVTFPAMLLDRPNDPDVENVMASESKLFEVRTTGRAGQKPAARQTRQKDAICHECLPTRTLLLCVSGDWLPQGLHHNSRPKPAQEI